MTNREKLVTAKRLVEEVRTEMNVNMHQCPACQLNVADNWGQMQTEKALGSISNRLGGLINSDALKQQIHTLRAGPQRTSR